MNLYLYGPPASGKTTLGKLLAERLCLPFLDLDAMIEAQAGMTVSALFARDGETAFRMRERVALEHLAYGKPAVVALGGGALLDTQARALAEETGDVLFLACDESILQQRAAAQAGTRPLLKGGADALHALLMRRATHYASFSHRVVAWFDLPSSVVLVGVNLPAVESYFAAPCHVWVTDKHVASLGFVASECVSFAEGEGSKNLETVSYLWKSFLQAGLARDGVVHALGGGVPSDLAGFAAASWMRGIAWTSRPTTLLAMVDASTGGKTGFDFQDAKNLIGAFHPPAVVMADVGALITLPLRQWRAGLAECIKHAIIADPELLMDLSLFEPLATLSQNAIFMPDLNRLAHFVARALAVKVGVVKRDPFEHGERAKLNLGHTIGHAVESASGFRFNHGESVAIGMVAEAREAVRLHLASDAWPEEVASMLARVGLPTKMPDDLPHDVVRNLMRHDKKKVRDRIVMALPVAMGDVRLVPVSLD